LGFLNLTFVWISHFSVFGSKLVI